jgi:hypothetical protein
MNIQTALTAPTAVALRDLRAVLMGAVLAYKRSRIDFPIDGRIEFGGEIYTNKDGLFYFKIRPGTDAERFKLEHH